ncbi:MAG: Negative regulator of flagellin synthesis [Candidatus Poribacteria bacterium]|nr:Negative regulator of flagellin synthesis [Candidatus Poribacteria bacterium]
MRIFNYSDSIQKIDKAYLRQSRSVEQKKTNSDGTKVRKTDELVLSPRIAELQKFEEMAKSLTEIQDDKASSIGKQIESGKYNVDGKSVAKSIIDLIG